MKKIIFLLVVFITFSCSAQKDSIIIPNAAKLTFSKVYSDVKEGIQGLAVALKTPAIHVYQVMIRQQIVKSIINVCTVLGLFLCCIIGANYARATYKEHIKLYSEQNGGSLRADIDDTPKGPLAVGLTIVSIGLGLAGVIVLCVTMQETITGFVNPEYGAIKEIISFVK